MTDNPGLQNQAKIRTGARVLGFALLLGGFAFGITGIALFAQSVNNMDTGGPDHGFLGIGLAAVGGFMTVFGIGALNAGFLGATSRYSAGEVSPVVKDTASYLSDGEGILGVGKIADAKPAKSGPFCSACGVRSDADAKFCGACGSALK